MACHHKMTSGLKALEALASPSRHLHQLLLCAS
jgi:hypothetical protein